MPSKKNIVDQFLSCLPSKSPGKLDFHFMGFNFDLRENKWIKEKELDESYMPDELLPPVKNRAANSTHRLSRMELQRASTLLKRFVEKRLEEDLGLVKVSCSNKTKHIDHSVFVFEVLLDLSS